MDAGPAAIPLLCPVRGCGEGLAVEARRAVCPRGHAFDRARSGYWNLLQPQDRKAAEPGDSKAAALARRRLAERGAEGPLHAALAELLLARLPGTGSAAVLDVGCGEGSLLAALLAAGRFAACGLDLSAPAVELAARRAPGATWVVANADRGLPFPGGTFDVALSVNARLPAAELARVLAPGGLLVVAVPGPDDLAALRARLHGEVTPLPGLATALPRLETLFVLESRLAPSWQIELDRAGLDDLLAASYRGARRRERERLGELA
ncbi:MAG TPA: methyltransferase domain-containing protein, partial [Thermoanaerobaculia bacterium]|nr:methyltransferase domain-containing protein [Thermoanaerobaculia bacterium]